MAARERQKSERAAADGLALRDDAAGWARGTPFFVSARFRHAEGRGNGTNSGLNPGVIAEDNSAAMGAGEIYARTANFNETQLNYFSTDVKSFGSHNAKVRRGSGSQRIGYDFSGCTHIIHSASHLLWGNDNRASGKNTRTRNERE